MASGDYGRESAGVEVVPYSAMATVCCRPSDVNGRWQLLRLVAYMKILATATRRPVEAARRHAPALAAPPARSLAQDGEPLPASVFASVTGTALDESNVRKAFNRLLDAADLDRRGPHQMRHTFASLLLQDGAPITYVSRQLGHKDAAITLRVYAHWLPDASASKFVDTLDDTSPRVTQASPAALDAHDHEALSALDGVVSRVGIEPTTRRLRVLCGESTTSCGVQIIREIAITVHRSPRFTLESNRLGSN
jgi:hypothetical protein